MSLVINSTTYATISVVVFVIGFLYCCYIFAEDYIKTDYSIISPHLTILFLVSLIWPVSVPIVLLVWLCMYIIHPYVKNRAKAIADKRLEEDLR